MALKPLPSSITEPQIDQAAVGPMRLSVSRLTISGFRSYAQARLETDDRSVVLTGANGAGKTNVLEALSLLTPGRGLRSAKQSDYGHRKPGADQAAPWAVAAEAMGREGFVALGSGQDPDVTTERPKRLVRIDGETRRAQSDLADHLAMLWLTPQMDRLFLEGPSARRRFLDRLVFAFDPAHAGRVSAYEQAMRERAKLLTSGCSDTTWLAALEETMAGRGVAVAAARLDLCRALDAFAADPSGPFPWVRLWIDGTVEQTLSQGSALAAEDELKAQLVSSRSRDAEAGGAAFGPHRADLCVRHGPKDQEAGLCSTGEQKALLVAIVLAHARLLAAEKDCRPILLLDEIAAHLDDEKRDALFDVVKHMDAQAWFTGTERRDFDQLTGFAKFYRVEPGRLTALEA